MSGRELLKAGWSELYQLLRWGFLASLVGIAVGLAVACFLWSLDRVTELFWRFPELLATLPLLGWLNTRINDRLGGTAAAGTNLILDEIHSPGAGVPLQMAPLVLVGTLLTHLGGGSAGREGTAVQMGGAIAGGLARQLKLARAEVPRLLMAGVAAGFGAVFGTPLAGAIFAMEVLSRGQIRHQSALNCLVAAYAGDRVVLALGLSHTHYSIHDFSNTAGLDSWMFAKVLLAAIGFGLASLLFVHMTHGIQYLLKATVTRPALRPVLAGFVIWVLVWLVGTREYLGLGVNANPAYPRAVTLQSSFQPGGASPMSWWWKILFTSATVGGGFKGGEVTPLFFIGASLGNALAAILNVPAGLLAALGFVAVFAAAANTPLACTVMALELFVLGQEHPPHGSFAILAALACQIAVGVSGSASIYSRQRGVSGD